MRRPYKKHFVLINGANVCVKDWYRQNPKFFIHLITTPTSEQIGTVLKRQGYTRSETITEVIYKR